MSWNDRLWQWPGSSTRGWVALWEASLCFQVSEVETERWTLGNWAKGLFWAELTWLGFHGTCGLRTTSLAKPFVCNSPQRMATAQRSSETWKIHARLPHTCAVSTAMADIWLIPSFLTGNLEACDSHVHSSMLRVSVLSGTVALSYWEHRICLPARVSLAFGISQEGLAMLLWRGCMTLTDQRCLVRWQEPSCGSQETEILALNSHLPPVWPWPRASTSVLIFINSIKWKPFPMKDLMQYTG